MPFYDYSCRLGHTTESRESYETAKIKCPDCGDTAYRLAVYQSQYTRTESGGMSGGMGRPRSEVVSSAAERVARNSRTIKKETGIESGPVLR